MAYALDRTLPAIEVKKAARTLTQSKAESAPAAAATAAPAAVAAVSGGAAHAAAKAGNDDADTGPAAGAGETDMLLKRALELMVEALGILLDRRMPRRAADPKGGE